MTVENVVTVCTVVVGFSIVRSTNVSSSWHQTSSRWRHSGG